MFGWGDGAFAEYVAAGRRIGYTKSANEGMSLVDGCADGADRSGLSALLTVHALHAAGDALVTLVERGEDERATRVIAQVLTQLHGVPQPCPDDGLLTLERCRDADQICTEGHRPGAGTVWLRTGHPLTDAAGSGDLARAAVSVLADDPRRRAMTARGREIVEARFSTPRPSCSASANRVSTCATT